MTIQPLKLIAPSGFAESNDPHLCDNGCESVSMGHKTFLFVQSKRISRITRVHFCSPECQTAWWISGGVLSNMHGPLSKHGLYDVHTPDNYHLVEICDSCGGKGISLIPDSTEKKECDRCHGEGKVSLPPPFFCSHDEAHIASHGDRFDRDIAIKVVDHGPDDPKLGKKSFDNIPNEWVVEAHRAECPHDVNQWFTQPITLEEHKQVRAFHRANIDSGTPKR